MEILDTMDLRPLKNAKIATKTHKMDVLEDETLESHIGGRAK
jgi:hypothetical protein